MKPLICDIPYPPTDNLTTDLKSGQIISFAYATLKGELTAILQYVYHSFHMANFNKEDAFIDRVKLKKEEKEESDEEN